MSQFQGTVVPAANFDAEADAKALRTAMKGLGTDEKAIIDVVAARTVPQLKQVESKYKQLLGRDLIEDLHSELSGHFREAVKARFLTYNEHAAFSLHQAIKGAGTDEDCLIEIFTTRSNADLHEIREHYKRLYKNELEKDVVGDTSGDFKRLCVSLLNGNRDESPNIDQAAAARDAQLLYQAGEGKWGTDEEIFNQIFNARSHAQLRAIFDEYSKLSKNDIEKVVNSEMSGYLKRGVRAIVQVARYPPTFFATALYESMKGAGTNDKALVRLVVSRADLDMVQIKQAFQQKYGKSLSSFIEGDTSGDYKKFLLALVGH